MDIYDLIGAILSLLCTYLFVKAVKRAWLLSALAIPFDSYVYYRSSLFGDMFLQCFYMASTYYGWSQWRSGGVKQGDLEISYSSIYSLLFIGCIAIIGIVIINPLLKPFNHANIALLDAITTVLSLCAQWLLCRKKIESWFLWFIVDAFYIYLYDIKTLPFHSVMALVYLIMAITGFYNWRKEYIKNTFTNEDVLHI